MKLFGAKSKIYLKYYGDIESLADKLSEGIILPKFLLETNDEAPHELTASCEAFGFEIWLERSNDYANFQFLLTSETELSLEESFNDQMHDLSPWLARFISKICKIESCIFDSETQLALIFKDGEIQ